MLLPLRILLVVGVAGFSDIFLFVLLGTDRSTNLYITRLSSSLHFEIVTQTRVEEAQNRDCYRLYHGFGNPWGETGCLPEVGSCSCFGRHY